MWFSYHFLMLDRGRELEAAVVETRKCFLVMTVMYDIFMYNMQA